MKRTNPLDNRSPKPPSEPPLIEVFYVLIVAAASVACAHVVEVLNDFARPPVFRMESVRQWYEHVFGLCFWISVLIACVQYLRYRHAAARAGIEVQPRPWRKRSESRMVLHVFVVLAILHFPLAILQLILEMRDEGYEHLAHHMLNALFGGMLPVVLAFFAIRYDRQRLASQAAMAGEACLHCGYDLRASPERCPECGQPVQRAPPGRR